MNGWIDKESLRQLRENNHVAYVKIVLQKPNSYGFIKIEIKEIKEEKK